MARLAGLMIVLLYLVGLVMIVATGVASLLLRNDSAPLEVWKTLFTPVAAVIFSGGVGGLLTFSWSTLQKQKESDITSSVKLYDLYGRYLSTWTLWNIYKNASGTGEAVWEKKDFPELNRWGFLKEAGEIEAGANALVLKLVTERRCRELDVAALALFRQAFRALRNHIREDEPVPWWSSSASGYVALRLVSRHMAGLIAASQWSLPSSQEAERNLLEVTGNWWEHEWGRIETARDLNDQDESQVARAWHATNPREVRDREWSWQRVTAEFVEDQHGRVQARLSGQPTLLATGDSVEDALSEARKALLRRSTGEFSVYRPRPRARMRLKMRIAVCTEATQPTEHSGARDETGGMSS